MNRIDSNESRSRRRITFRGRASAKLVGALAAASLAIPAAASGYTVPGNPTGSSQATTDRPTAAPASLQFPSTAALVQHQGGSNAASDTTALVLHRDGSKAEPFVADVSTPSVAATPGDGFDWGDAVIGAGAALGIIALGGAGLTLRRHRPVPTRSVLSGS
jgi:hypothetical protein